VIFEIKGKKAYSKMRYEAGVHRVQRIPKTERKGRIHTSTATVAVLPKPKIKQIETKPEELRIETFRSSGPGGQHMQKTESAVRITHLPTGITASSQSSRSQAQNKENAMRILEAYLLERSEKKKLEQQIQQRKSQIKMAKRAEKGRTYNFPQNRVTDHRIKKSWHNLEKILEGDLDKVVNTLAKKLKE
jgi:peptide chain release factor 1